MLGRINQKSLMRRLKKFGNLYAQVQLDESFHLLRE